WVICTTEYAARNYLLLQSRPHIRSAPAGAIPPSMAGLCGRPSPPPRIRGQVRFLRGAGGQQMSSSNTQRVRFERGNLYQEITDKIIAELEQGRCPWVQPWGAANASL